MDEQDAQDLKSGEVHTPHQTSGYYANGVELQSPVSRSARGSRQGEMAQRHRGTRAQRWAPAARLLPL